MTFKILAMFAFLNLAFSTNAFSYGEIDLSGPSSMWNPLSPVSPLNSDGSQQKLPCGSAEMKALNYPVSTKIEVKLLDFDPGKDEYVMNIFRCEHVQGCNYWQSYRNGEMTINSSTITHKFSFDASEFFCGLAPNYDGFAVVLEKKRHIISNLEVGRNSLSFYQILKNPMDIPLIRGQKPHVIVRIK